MKLGKPSSAERWPDALNTIKGCSEDRYNRRDVTPAASHEHPTSEKDLSTSSKPKPFTVTPTLQSLIQWGDRVKVDVGGGAFSGTVTSWVRQREYAAVIG
jgi:hypothetical protein